MEKLSFVIPCYGSELTIEGVLDEIHEVMLLRPEFDYEIICVNDCSPDNVLAILKNRAQIDPRVTVVDLTKNMGKTIAVLAGYSLITGDYEVDLDDDGQCPLDKLWELFAAIENGSDLAYAGYSKKKQSGFKIFGSMLNALMAHHLIGKPKSLVISNFSIRRGFLVKEALKYKGAYPYTLGISINATNKITNVPMEERDRAAGRGNFTLRKSFAMWMNGFTAFSTKPLQISSFVGLLIALTGFVCGIILIIRKLFISPNIAVGYPSTIATLLFIGGMIMLMLGMLGEYVGRIYINQNNLSQYIIRDVYNGSDSIETR